MWMSSGMWRRVVIHIYQCCRGPCCVHHQGRWITPIVREAGYLQLLYTCTRMYGVKLQKQQNRCMKLALYFTWMFAYQTRRTGRRMLRQLFRLRPCSGHNRRHNRFRSQRKVGTPIRGPRTTGRRWRVVSCYKWCAATHNIQYVSE